MVALFEDESYFFLKIERGKIEIECFYCVCFYVLK